MGEIKYKTESIIKAAETIDKSNEKRKAEFEKLSRKVRNLGNSWKSSASEKVLNQFTVIENQYEGQRYLTMKNQSDYLRKVVTVGYDSAENANTENAKNCI